MLLFFSVGHRRSEGSQSFSYDPFGNIKKINNGGATSYGANYSTATNQVSSGITPSPIYDANGNQKNLTATNEPISWNAANQPVSINGITATYDALGRMVETGSGSSYQQFVFRPSGAILAVYNAGTSSLVKGTVPLPGGETAIYNSSGLSYIRHTDWLGSSRFSTTWGHAVYAKESYAPFGETYNEAGTADRSYTGQDQDVVSGSGGTGVYDFLYRKHDPSAGRWLSPDPSGWSAVDLTNPQSLNRYGYVLNSPLSLIDQLGTCPQLFAKYTYKGNNIWTYTGVSFWGDNGLRQCGPPNPGCVYQMNAEQTQYTGTVCQPYSGQQGSNQNTGSGGGGGPNNAKSPARQQCEAAAQQQFNQSNQAIQHSLLPNIQNSAISGAIHGAVVGCVGGAVAGTSAGLLLGPEGAPVGAVAGCIEFGESGAAIGALSETAFSIGHSIWDLGVTALTYKQQMNSCSKL